MNGGFTQLARGFHALCAQRLYTELIHLREADEDKIRRWKS